jgi:ribose transport system substrate-binding protein
MAQRKIQGLVLQNPLHMADLAVQTLLDGMAGKTVPKRIDTGEYMITPQNMKQPQMDALLHPPVGQYLK